MKIGVNGELTNPTREGGIVAIYYLGGIIGGLWGGDIADKYGRIKGTLFGCLWCIVGGSFMVSFQYRRWTHSFITDGSV